MKFENRAKYRLKIWEVSLLLAAAAFLLSGAMSLQSQSNLADQVVRLHVLANSDTEEDQALKLQVRDAVLEQAERILGMSANRSEAESVLRGQLLEFERIGEAVVQEAGYDYQVTVELADSHFPTREYKSFTLPAGKYLALRVLIGEAAGQNWWCVVFPPLCTTASVSVTAMSAGLSEEQVQLMTEEDQGYVLKLKSLEFWEALRQKWEAVG